jgi:uncharacterized protein
VFPDCLGLRGPHNRMGLRGLDNDGNGTRGVAGAVVFHSVAGFLGRSKVRTAHLVEAGGDLPVVVTFVDTDEHVSRVLPKLREMAAHRLIVRENVVIEQGSLD